MSVVELVCDNQEQFRLGWRDLDWRDVDPNEIETLAEARKCYDALTDNIAVIEARLEERPTLGLRIVRQFRHKLRHRLKGRIAYLTALERKPRDLEHERQRSAIIEDRARAVARIQAETSAEAEERKHRLKMERIAASRDQQREKIATAFKILRERFGDEFMTELYAEIDRRMGTAE